VPHASKMVTGQLVMQSTCHRPWQVGHRL